MATAPSLCLFGCPLDTGNLGVSALGLSILYAIARRPAHTQVTLFDNGTDVRRSNATFPDGSSQAIVHRGARHSRRLHRPDTLRTMLATSMLPGVTTDHLRVIDEADAVLDVSGGDSFADIYGLRRFDAVTLPKRIVLRRGRPLILLPQTYGPYRSERARSSARRVVMCAQSAWARDPDSFDRLRELLGDGYDPSRHRCGADIAFTLPAREPPADVVELLDGLSGRGPLVGVNISGLLASTGERASRFGIRADYARAMERLVHQLITQTDANVLLVPHVISDRAESDLEACTSLASRLGAPGRLAVLPESLDAMQSKWVISRMDWFTGARMHATIAALSTGVPVTGVAYSDKMRGVFRTAGVPSEVVDGRSLDTDGLVEALLDAFRRRDATRALLSTTITTTRDTAARALDDILSPLLGSAV